MGYYERMREHSLVKKSFLKPSFCLLHAKVLEVRVMGWFPILFFSIFPSFRDLKVFSYFLEFDLLDHAKNSKDENSKLEVSAI